jgi:membrane protein
MKTLRALIAQIKTFYTKANKLSQGILGISVDAIQSFMAANGGEGAASIAYYALFSLFPLLVFLVSIGGAFLESKSIQQQVLAFAGEVFPSSRELVAKNIQQILELRSTAGVVAIIGLLWSATSVFTVLARHINRAWHTAEVRNFLQGRLIALAMVGSLIILLFLSLLSSTILSILNRFQINLPFLGGAAIYQTSIWTLLSRLLPWLVNFALFTALYWWVPNTKVKWSAAVWGALVTAFAWEILKAGFGWYLKSGLSHFDIAYGSLATVIILLMWIYLSSLVVLFGAHLSAVIARHSKFIQKHNRSESLPLV